MLANLSLRVQKRLLREKCCRLAPTGEGSRWRRASCVCPGSFGRFSAFGGYGLRLIYFGANPLAEFWTIVQNGTAEKVRERESLLTVWAGCYCVSGSDFKVCARRACCARTTASSTSTRFFSSWVRTVLFRGGGMSWTAGKAGAICGRLGASCDMPPAETGNCAILEHEAREPAAADTSANPSKKWVNRH
jgi:hypothetical protein